MFDPGIFPWGRSPDSWLADPLASFLIHPQAHLAETVLWCLKGG